MIPPPVPVRWAASERMYSGCVGAAQIKPAETCLWWAATPWGLLWVGPTSQSSFYLLFIDLFIYDLRPNLLREWLQQTKASSLFLLEEKLLLGYSAEVLHVFWLVKYLSFSQQAATNEFINFSSSAASRHNNTELLKKSGCCQSTFPQTEEPNLP